MPPARRGQPRKPESLFRTLLRRRPVLLRYGPAPTFFRDTAFASDVCLRSPPGSGRRPARSPILAIALARTWVARLLTRSPTRWSTGGFVEVAIRCRRLGISAMTQRRENPDGVEPTTLCTQMYDVAAVDRLQNADKLPLVSLHPRRSSSVFRAGRTVRSRHSRRTETYARPAFVAGSLARCVPSVPVRIDMSRDVTSYGRTSAQSSRKSSPTISFPNATVCKHSGTFVLKHRSVPIGG